MAPLLYEERVPVKSKKSMVGSEGLSILISSGICYITYTKSIFVKTRNHGYDNAHGNR
jgi:hypothetical protein